MHMLMTIFVIALRMIIHKVNIILEIEDIEIPTSKLMYQFYNIIFTVFIGIRLKMD